METLILYTIPAAFIIAAWMELFIMVTVPPRHPLGGIFLGCIGNHYHILVLCRLSKWKYKMARYKLKLPWLLGSILFGWFAMSIIVSQAERIFIKDKLIAICEAHNLYAIDIDYPHTPKCLDRKTGLMTVPDDLLAIRGRM